MIEYYPRQIFTGKSLFDATWISQLKRLGGDGIIDSMLACGVGLRVHS